MALSEKSPLPSLDLSLERFYASDVGDVGIAELFELGNGCFAAGAALAIDKDRSIFVMQQIYGIVDFRQRDVAAASDMAAAVFIFCTDIDKDSSLGRPAAVDFLVDIYSFKKIQK